MQWQGVDSSSSTSFGVAPSFFPFSNNSMNAFASSPSSSSMMWRNNVTIMEAEEEEEEEEEAPTRQKNRGRRKIAIEKIENSKKKQVTFSKRKKGLFSKAAELCILCGAHVAVLTFSDSGKLFAFGHPSADSVIRRYLYGAASNTVLVPISSPPLRTLSFSSYPAPPPGRPDLVSNGLKKWAVKKDRDGIGLCGPVHQEEDSGVVYWWEEAGVEDGMGLEELEVLLKALEGLRSNVLIRLLDGQTRMMMMMMDGGDHSLRYLSSSIPPSTVSNSMMMMMMDGGDHSLRCLSSSIPPSTDSNSMMMMMDGGDHSLRYLSSSVPPSADSNSMMMMMDGGDHSLRYLSSSVPPSSDSNSMMMMDGGYPGPDSTTTQQMKHEPWRRS